MQLHSHKRSLRSVFQCTKMNLDGRSPRGLYNWLPLSVNNSQHPCCHGIGKDEEDHSRAANAITGSKWTGTYKLLCKGLNCSACLKIGDTLNCNDILWQLLGSFSACPKGICITRRRTQKKNEREKNGQDKHFAGIKG